MVHSSAKTGSFSSVFAVATVCSNASRSAGGSGVCACSRALSFLLYDSTSTGTEKCVRKMCLFLMVEGSIVIYTLIRNSVTGQAGVRKNWSFFFTTVPDIQVAILNEVTEGDSVWAELHFHGMQTDGKRHSTRGVTLQGIQADQITWARLYIETLQEPH
jgi:hypothetical protein